MMRDLASPRPHLNLDKHRREHFMEHARQVERECEKLLAQGHLLDELELIHTYDVEDKGRDGMIATHTTTIVYKPSGRPLTTVN